MSLKLSRREGSPFWWITGSVSGTRIRESTGTVDRGIADEYRAARENALHRAAIHGAPVARATFATCVVSYLQHGGPHSDATRARIRRILDEVGPLTAADDIDQARIDVLCLKLLRPGPAPATRLREVTTPIRAILTHAAKRRLCAVPAFEIGKPSPVRTEWLSPAEAERLVAVAAEHLQPLLVFLIGTGARMSEALTLDWSDVDLSHAQANLRDTKPGTHRPAALCPRVVAALAAMEGRIGHVFRTQTGAPYLPRKIQGGGQIKTAWAHAKRAAAITKPITPHGLRHTWASWHYACHRDLLKLKVEGGWSKVEMVERYAHLMPDGMVDAIHAFRGTLLTQKLPQRQKSRVRSR